MSTRFARCHQASFPMGMGRPLDTGPRQPIPMQVMIEASAQASHLKRRLQKNMTCPDRAVPFESACNHTRSPQFPMIRDCVFRHWRSCTCLPSHVTSRSRRDLKKNRACSLCRGCGQPTLKRHALDVGRQFYLLPPVCERSQVVAVCDNGVDATHPL